MRVAIVGSGPAGFYAAEALLRRTDVRVEVDVFDRLPTPYGLVRGGVAPDHQKIKTVARVFAATTARSRTCAATTTRSSTPPATRPTAASASRTRGSTAARRPRCSSAGTT